MKGYMICIFAFLFLAFLVPAAMSSSRSIAGRHRGRARMKVTPRHKDEPNRSWLSHSRAKGIIMNNKGGDVERVQMVAGSKLPDCSHACGSCSPCRLVMVSFVCASLAEAETCPMAYKCMCRNKSFPVP